MLTLFSGWCATSTTVAFDFIDGKWGYCEEKCLGTLWENIKNTYSKPNIEHKMSPQILIITNGYVNIIDPNNYVYKCVQVTNTWNGQCIIKSVCNKFQM